MPREGNAHHSATDLRLKTQFSPAVDVIPATFLHLSWPRSQQINMIFHATCRAVFSTSRFSLVFQVEMKVDRCYRTSNPGRY